MKKLVFSLYLLTATLFADAQTTDTVSVPTFVKVEVEAEFPGGVSEWSKYLQKNLKANTPADNGAPIGVYQVIVRFIVTKEGKISNVEAETDHGYGMEQEVIRILKKGPDWLPASQNDKKVNAYRRQPVTFVVQQEGIDVNSASSLGLGVENEISIIVSKIDDEYIEVETDNGTIKKVQGAGKYILVPSKAGKAIVNIYANKKSKRKKLGTASFRVVAL